MRAKLEADDYRFDILVESIVTSPQFLTKRGRDDLAAIERVSDEQPAQSRIAARPSHRVRGGRSCTASA